MFKIGVLASTNGTDLGAIIEEMKAGKMPGIELVRVLSNVEDAGALQKALDFGVEALFVDPAGLSKSQYDERLVEAMGDVDLVCLIGYMRILTPIFLNKYRVVNVHPALLPKYGGKGMYGMLVHEAVLEAGESESGMSIHEVDEGVDTGRILMQKKVAIEEGETPESLKVKVQKLEMEAYPELIRRLANEV